MDYYIITYIIYILYISASFSFIQIDQYLDIGADTNWLGGVLDSDIDYQGRVPVWSVDRRCVFFAPVMHI